MTESSQAPEAGFLTLGVETSCDETSVAVVADGARILSNVVASQVELHRAFGGVVPELAAREHIERLPLVLDRALADASVNLGEIDLVAVTRGPGLIGALLVGVGFASGLALDRGLPIVGVSHLDGHLRSAFLQAPDLELPLLTLIASGGHTELWLVEEDSPVVLGRTLDDAAGEAFDKVARLLGLRYPGGPEVERSAADIDPAAAEAAFPLPAIKVSGMDFSFSGIKTAVRYGLERRVGTNPAMAAASFQARAVEHLASRIQTALDLRRVRTVAIVGGVAMNGELRRRVGEVIEAHPSRPRLVLPAPSLCTDNAAMIAAAGHHLWLSGQGQSLEVDPGLRAPSGLGANGSD